jgi:hypothetical protein
MVRRPRPLTAQALEEGLRQILTCPHWTGGDGGTLPCPLVLRNPAAACFLFDTAIPPDSRREKSSLSPPISPWDAERMPTDDKKCADYAVSRSGNTAGARQRLGLDCRDLGIWLVGTGRTKQCTYNSFIEALLIPYAGGSLLEGGRSSGSAVELEFGCGRRIREVDDVVSAVSSGFDVVDSAVAGPELYGVGALVLVEGRAQALSWARSGLDQVCLIRARFAPRD